MPNFNFRGNLTRNDSCFRGNFPDCHIREPCWLLLIIETLHYCITWTSILFKMCKYVDICCIIEHHNIVEGCFTNGIEPTVALFFNSSFSDRGGLPLFSAFIFSYSCFIVSGSHSFLLFFSLFFCPSQPFRHIKFMLMHALCLCYAKLKFNDLQIALWPVLKCRISIHAVPLQVHMYVYALVIGSYHCVRFALNYIDMIINIQNTLAL